MMNRVTTNGTIDGQPFEGGSGENIPIVLGAGRMLADFETGLVGSKAGEQRTIKLTFPQNYGAPALAGKQAEFAVNVKSVEERHLPELDDEFCKLYGVEQGGIEQLRREVEENMRRELTDAIRARVKKQVLDGLAAANPLELPKSMVDAQVRDMQIDAGRRMGARDASQLPPPDAFQEAARRRVQLSLLVGEVIKKRKPAPAKSKSGTAAAGTSTACSLVRTASEYMRAADSASAWRRSCRPRRNRISDSSENRVASTMLRWTR